MWDDATMSNKLALEAVAETLSKTCERSLHLWWQCNGLQWRFTLCAIEVDACFKVSKLWEHDQVMHLSTNMGVHLRAGTLAGKSADILLKNG